MRRGIERLTDEQRARAADPGALDVARIVARFYARFAPHLADEILSAAYYGVVRAAASYVSGSFPALVWSCARGEILNRLRAERPRGYREPHLRVGTPSVVPLTRPAPPVGRGAPGQQIGDALPSGDAPVGWELESADGVRALARRLPAHQAEAVVALFLACEVGGVLRRTDAKLRGRANRGLAVLREALASRGAA